MGGGYLVATIELKNICKRFEREIGLSEIIDYFTKKIRLEADTISDKDRGSFAIESLNLTIPDGKVMVILGPTGCGKSTLLRIIAGLIKPDSGDIYYDGVSVENVPPGKRRIGMVFQNYALYPHFTSKENILSYFFFRKRTPELDEIAGEKYRKTSELLGIDIEYLMNRKPPSLSGGEKQRVALGRCITREPTLFLLDEPFSNLDRKLRDEYRVQLKKLLRHFTITTVYVTHDQQEALILADILTIMNVGSIEQVGTPEDIYNYPHSVFVAKFLNLGVDTPAINLLDGETISEKFQGLLVGVRSEDIELCEEPSEDAFIGTITDIRPIPLRRATVLDVTIGEDDLYVQIPFEKDVSRNDKIQLRFKRYHFFDKNTGRRVRSYPEEP